VIVAEVELDEEPGEKLAKNDAGLGLVIWDISGKLDELGKVEIVEREASNLGDKLIAVRRGRRGKKTPIQRDIRRPHIYNNTVDGNKDSANCQSDRHYLVLCASFIEVFSQCPRGCIGIVRLHGRTAPGRVTIAVNEEFAISVHNGDHDSVIDKSAQYSTINLSKEHNTGRDFDCTDVLAATDCTAKLYLRYSPIFKSLHRLREF
jgi:hypothetical protein